MPKKKMVHKKTGKYMQHKTKSPLPKRGNRIAKK